MDYLPAVNWVFEKFGTAGLIILYFLVKDYLAWKGNRDKQKSGTWINLHDMNALAQKEAEKQEEFRQANLKIEEKQHEILGSLAVTMSSSREALARIEGFVTPKG